MSTAKAPAAPSGRICEKNIALLVTKLGNTRFYFGHQKLCMDNNILYYHFGRFNDLLIRNRVIKSESCFSYVIAIYRIVPAAPVHWTHTCYIYTKIYNVLPS